MVTLSLLLVTVWAGLGPILEFFEPTILTPRMRSTSPSTLLSLLHALHDHFQIPSRYTTIRTTEAHFGAVGWSLVVFANLTPEGCGTTVTKTFQPSASAMGRTPLPMHEICSSCWRSLCPLHTFPIGVKFLLTDYARFQRSLDSHPCVVCQRALLCCCTDLNL